MSVFKIWFVLAVMLFHSASAEAFRGGGGRGGGRMGGGGARVAARTTFSPAVGVTRSTTVASRYHRPVQPVYRPGVGNPGTVNGLARRTARRTANRVAYRTSYGTSYYYGAAVYAQPTGCYSTWWEGIAAYNCGGVMYVYTDGAYYPLEYI